MIRGADISGWQPAQVNLDGLEFVYVKATQGLFKVNANHDAQVAQARAAGLIVGHYHFPAWGNPVAEARAFVSCIDWRPGEFAVLDIENSPVTPWPVDPVSWAVAFELEVYRLLGIWAMDYDGPNVRHAWNWAPLAALGGGLISPEYNNTGPSDPSPWANVAMWQNADTNISGGDSDVFYGDRAALIAYGTPGAVAQSGTITPTQEDEVVTPSDIDAIAAAVENRIFNQHMIENHVVNAPPDTFHNWAAFLEARLKNHAYGAAGTVAPDVLNHSFTLADGTVTNLTGLLAQIRAERPTVAPLAALSTGDVEALAKAANDEADARARTRLK